MLRKEPPGSSILSSVERKSGNRVPQLIARKWSDNYLGCWHYLLLNMNTEERGSSVNPLSLCSKIKAKGKDGNEVP